MRLTAGIALASAGLGLALGIALTDGRVQKAKAAHESDRALWAAQLADARDQALQAEQAAAAREHALQAEFDKLDQEARHAKQALETDRAAAAAASDRLRQQIAALSARPVCHPANPDPAPAGIGSGQRDTAALDLLANLFTRADSAAGELAEYAAALRDAGQDCEQRCDRVRAGLSSPF